MYFPLRELKADFEQPVPLKSKPKYLVDRSGSWKGMASSVILSFLLNRDFFQTGTRTSGTGSGGRLVAENHVFSVFMDIPAKLKKAATTLIFAAAAA